MSAAAACLLAVLLHANAPADELLPQPPKPARVSVVTSLVVGCGLLVAAFQARLLFRRDLRC